MGIARLVKDNKFELIQIQNTEGNSDYKGEANLFYLKKATSILELVSGPEHPMVGNCYAMISFAYYDTHNIQKATKWMRKAFCVFYSTLGSLDEVTMKGCTHLLRLEGSISSKYQFLQLEQLAMSLIDLLETEADEDSFEEDHGHSKKALNYDMEKRPKAIMG